MGDEQLDDNDVTYQVHADMPPHIDKLATALAKAQAEIQHAKEDARNPHFGSRYATLASVWNACREPLTKYGLSVAQVPTTHGRQLTVKTILMHASGQCIVGELTVTAKSDEAQAIGSAITYARRYGLAAMVGVAPSDDDDGEVAHARVPSPPPSPPKKTPPPGRPMGYDPTNEKHNEYLRSELIKRKITDVDVQDLIAVKLKGRSFTDIADAISEVLEQ